MNAVEHGCHLLAVVGICADRSGPVKGPDDRRGRAQHEQCLCADRTGPGTGPVDRRGRAQCERVVATWWRWCGLAGVDVTVGHANAVQYMYGGTKCAGGRGGRGDVSWIDCGRARGG